MRIECGKLLIINKIDGLPAWKKRVNLVNNHKSCIFILNVGEKRQVKNVRFPDRCGTAPKRKTDLENKLKWYTFELK
jgi:hypothetical protein